MAAKSGPQKDRSCTDLVCLVVFAVFIGSLCVVMKMGFSKGDPYRLAYPYDYDRNYFQTSNNPF